MTNLILLFLIIYFFILDVLIIAKQFRIVALFIVSGIIIAFLSLSLFIFSSSPKKIQKQEENYVVQKTVIAIEFVVIILLAIIILTRTSWN